MALVRLERNPKPRVLRTFGISLGLTGVAIGAVLHFAADATVAGAVVAGVLVLLGIVPAVAPRLPLARWLFIGFSAPALVIGNVVSVVFVSVVYYLLVTPIGALRRIFGKDPLHLKSPPGSLWVATSTSDDPESYERQF